MLIKIVFFIEGARILCAFIRASYYMKMNLNGRRSMALQLIARVEAEQTNAQIPEYKQISHCLYFHARR